MTSESSPPRRRDRRPKREVHALDENGMLVCNPRDPEAAHRADNGDISTGPASQVTCKKCLDRMTDEQRRGS